MTLRALGSGRSTTSPAARIMLAGASKSWVQAYKCPGGRGCPGSSCCGLRRHAGGQRLGEDRRARRDAPRTRTARLVATSHSPDQAPAGLAPLLGRIVGVLFGIGARLFEVEHLGQVRRLIGDVDGSNVLHTGDDLLNLLPGPER